MSSVPRSARARGYALALGGATTMATIGLFYTVISDRYGVAPETIVFARVCVAVCVLAVGLLVARRDLLRIRRADIPMLVGLGLFGYGLLYVLVARAVVTAGVAVSVVLLNTSPVWVCLYEWCYKHERPDRRRIVALAGTIVGVALVAQVYDLARVNVNGLGMAYGLGSGILGGAWSVLSRRAVQRYSPWTVTAIGLAVTLVVLAIAQGPREFWGAVTAPGAIWWFIALGAGPTSVGPLLWGAGMRWIPASAASIVGMWEPVVASLLALLLLGERLEPGQIAGAVLIVASIVLLGSGDLGREPGIAAAAREEAAKR